jgi:chromate transport protein ChrA
MPNRTENGDSWIWKAIDATIKFRFTIIIFSLIIIASLRWPLVFVGVLVLGVAYCVYRIVKDRASSARKESE